MEYKLTSINPEENRNRYYHITVQPGLFGGFTVIREWGRIGTKGKHKTQTFETEKQTEKEIQKVLRVRERHGYIRIK